MDLDALFGRNILEAILPTKRGRGRPKGPVPTFVCEYCGKVCERYLCRTLDGKHSSYSMKQRFCSKECGLKGRKWRPISENGHIHSSGYRRLHRRGGIKVYQHRVVMEAILGRPLDDKETVHHKDGNKLNNDPSNLELWVSRQPGGQRVTDLVEQAIDLLHRYPEFAERQGYRIVEVEPAGRKVEIDGVPVFIPARQVNAPAFTKE